MKLIIGLGNPGSQYGQTRHNLGFMVLDEIATERGVEFKATSKFHGDMAEFKVESEKVLLLKPSTFYNESGRAARAVVDFYKIPNEDILIIHDELMLPFGCLRSRIGGSDAGNNGIKSINSHIGANTKRLRIGIYSELRDQMDDASFVLSKFNKTEADQLADINKIALEIVGSFINDKFVAHTHTCLPLSDQPL